jgi:hypothetical protein
MIRNIGKKSRNTRTRGEAVDEKDSHRGFHDDLSDHVGDSYSDLVFDVCIGSNSRAYAASSAALILNTEEIRKKLGHIRGDGVRALRIAADLLISLGPSTRFCRPVNCPTIDFGSAN